MFNFGFFRQITFIGILLTTVGQVLAQPPDWFSRIRKISILESERHQVEKLLAGIKVFDQQEGILGTNVVYKYRKNRLTVQ
ncbi:MAG TPA: hypothetical protein VJ781_00350, partial [Pyrinomonadaceae bacterium]|nr:hypothetical protein [Pyrinomonadaceae bacterium]